MSGLNTLPARLLWTVAAVGITFFIAGMYLEQRHPA